MSCEHSEPVNSIPIQQMSPEAMVSIDWSKLDELDVLPIAVNLGSENIIQSIDFDDAAIIRRMQDEGLTIPQIANQQIRVDFSDKYNVNATGSYEPQSGNQAATISLHLGNLVEKAYNTLTEGSTRISGEELDYASSRTFTNTLWHEIRHARQIVVEGHTMEDIAAYRKKWAMGRGGVIGTAIGVTIAAGVNDFFASSSLGPRAASIWAATGMISAIAYASRHWEEQNANDDYHFNPFEIDARNAGDEITDNVVHLKLTEVVLPALLKAETSAKDGTDIADSTV